MGGAAGSTDAADADGGPPPVPQEAGPTTPHHPDGGDRRPRLEVEEAELPDGRRVARYRHGGALTP